MLITVLAKDWKPPKCPSTRELLYDIYLQWNIMQLFKKLRLTPWHISKRNENICPQKTCANNLINALFRRSPNWNNSNVHQGRRNKLAYSYSGTTLSNNNKRNEGIHTTTGMNFKSIVISKINHTHTKNALSDSLI